MTRHPHGFLIFATLFLHLGCTSTGVGNPDDDAGPEDGGLSTTEQALVEDGNDSLDTNDLNSGLAYLPVLSIGGKLDIVDGPTAATSAAKLASDPYNKIFVDVGCVKATPAGNVTTFTLTNCAIVGGSLRAIDGTVVATYNAIAADQIQVTIKSDFTHLSVYNRKNPVKFTDITSLQQSGSTTLTIIAIGKRSYSWNGRFVGLTPTGRSITHDAVYTWTKEFATGCLEIPIGATTSTIDPPLRGLTVSISDYKRCGTASACPSSGNLVFTDKASGLSVSIRFLGGRLARVTSPLGRAFDMALDCVP